MDRDVPNWRSGFVILYSSFSLLLFSTSLLKVRLMFSYLRSELELMLEKGVKFEIEALSAHSLSFLSDNYLPSKIVKGAYI